MALTAVCVAGLAGCGAGTTVTSTPQPTNESRSTDGFEFQVNVSNTHPRLGETIIITTILQNISNTNGITLPDAGGQTSIEIRNSAGQLVWGIAQQRSGTTLTSTIGIGSVIGGTANFTWTVTRNPQYTVPVTAGIYTLSVSDTGFYDPSLNMQIPFSVTPIQITVVG